MSAIRAAVGLVIGITIASIASASEPDTRVILEDRAGLFEHSYARIVHHLESVLSRLGRADRLCFVTESLSTQEWEKGIVWVKVDELRDRRQVVSRALRERALGQAKRDGLVVLLFVHVRPVAADPPKYRTDWAVNIIQAGSLATEMASADAADADLEQEIRRHFSGIELVPGHFSDQSESLEAVLVRTALVDLESSLRVKPERPPATNGYQVTVFILAGVLVVLSAIWITARLRPSTPPRAPAKNPFDNPTGTQPNV